MMYHTLSVVNMSYYYEGRDTGHLRGLPIPTVPCDIRFSSVAFWSISIIVGDVVKHCCNCCKPAVVVVVLFKFKLVY